MTRSPAGPSGGGGDDPSGLTAAVAAVVWVAIEEWQAQDGGREELGALIDQALGTGLGAGAPLRATPTASTQ